jgi:hypothetical protein
MQLQTVVVLTGNLEPGHPRRRKRCAESAQACQRNQLNSFRMFIVAARPTLHQCLANGLAGLEFHLCLSGTFGQPALGRMFQNETRPTLKTVNIAPYGHCRSEEKLGRCRAAFRRAILPKRLSHFVSERHLWQPSFGQAVANDGRKELKIVRNMNKAVFENR